MDTSRHLQRRLRRHQFAQAHFLASRVTATALCVAIFLACGQSDPVPEREKSLRRVLRNMRQCIHEFRADKGRLPGDLQELVSAHYIRKVPIDPITGTTTSWHTVLAPASPLALASPRIIDVRSGAPGLSSAGTPYSTW